MSAAPPRAARGPTEGPPAVDATDPRDEPLRSQLRTITVAWIFGAFWLSTISGSALTRFQLALGTPERAFGILAAIPFAANLAQLPATLLQARYGHRKAIFLVTVTLGRLMWAIAAAIPWVLRGEEHRDLRWPVMMLVLFVGWCLNSAGSPAWMDWMADVIPRRLRGRFFGSRNRIGQWISAAATIGVGYAVDLASSTGDDRVVLTVTSAILAIAGLAGALDVLRFVKLRDPQPTIASRGPGLLETIRQPLSDANFRRYLYFNFAFNVAVGFIGQYIWLYVLQHIRFPAWQANLLLIAVPAVLFSLAYGFWGPIIDRFGKKPVMLICGAVIIHGGWGWILIGHGAWPVTVAGYTFSLASVIGYTVAQISVLCWPGYEIANFNILLGLAGTGEGRRSGTAYVAVHSIAVALGGIISGFIGGTVAARFAGFTWLIPVLGIHLSYHGLLLILSTVLRALSFTFITRLEDPKALPTRDALRYVTTNLYNNAIEVIHWPTRIAGQAYRLTYRFTPRL